MSESIRSEIVKYPIENDEGNIEYKLKLMNFNDEKLNKRLTQMKYRLTER
jgi:GTPase